MLECPGELTTSPDNALHFGRSFPCRMDLPFSGTSFSGADFTVTEGNTKQDSCVTWKSHRRTYQGLVLVMDFPHPHPHSRAPSGTVGWLPLELVSSSKWGH